MPVPVPRFSKPLAHPVIKQSGDANPNHPAVFKNLTCTLPVAPTGPPPSFGTRQQWINSLPSWRRTKPRRIWEDDNRSAEHSGEHNFPQGLTAAANAPVIKGTRAQACIPPLSTLFQTADSSSTLPSGLLQTSSGDVDEEMSSDYSSMEQTHQSQWSASSPPGNSMDTEGPHYDAVPWNSMAPAANSYGGSAFSPPMFEDDSPAARDAASSPLEPATPFGEFVDRAVAAHGYAPFPTVHPVMAAQEVQHSFQGEPCGPECYQALSYVQVEQPKEQPVATEIATPSATASYRKLAEPLSEWVANYVWKVCTTGLSLPSASCIAIDSYPASPPSYLAASVHSLLLSTLLQPSAVLLAIWYIVRLPVQFGNSRLGAEHMSKLSFRSELFGDPSTGVDRDALEANAPFRLILLGFMLANKWLDDHTFSNKTWHSISNVPVQSLNKLESLALGIFSHDLSVSTKDWCQWLSHLLSYHISLSSPSHPQPISRPSTNPHSIIRKTIEELIQAPAACSQSHLARPEPVFLGLEERKKEKLEKEQAMAENYVDVLEIDLDEDGPLREEYLPKRRISAAGSMRGPHGVPVARPAEMTQVWDSRVDVRLVHMEKLPPPAKWSPAGDEPILRERNRASGHYVAVQPPLLGPYNAFPYGDSGYQNWMGNGYAVKQPAPLGYAYDPASAHVPQTTYHPYPFALPMPLAHSRSHSLSYSQDNSHAHNRPRTYSQSRYEYRYSDIRMAANELAPLPAHDAHWGAPSDPYAYSAPYIQTFVPHPGLNYQPPWLRN
jgi:hypothetical protein